MSHTGAAWDVSFRLFTADSSSGIPVFPSAATFGHDAVMAGNATATFPAGDDALELLGSTLGSEFANVALRVFHGGDLSRPIWSGVAIATKLSTTRRGQVEITFEHFWSYFQRIRAVFAAAYAVTDFNEEADNVALKTMRAQIGPTPTVPAGHPGTRDDFGPFSPVVASNHSPALAPTRRFVEQSGNNLLEVTNGLFSAADLAPVLTDACTGAFTLDNDYPFEENDLTESVIFGQYRGNLTSFELISDRAAQANIWAVEGKTAYTPQFASDAGSMTVWGEIEAFASKPEDSAVSAALARTAADLRDGYAETRVSYRAELIETEGHEFVHDFWWRDKIRIEEAVFGLTIEQTVKSWQMQTEGGRVRQLDIGLGVPKAPDLMRHVAGYTGRPGPQFAGNVFRNKRSP